MNIRYTVKSSGFTIIELLAVIAIIGILSTIGIVSFSKIQTSTRDAQRSSKIEVISQALEKYYNTNGEYPNCAALIVAPSVVTSITLKGMDPDALTAPSDAMGANSITCSSSNDDNFAYLGGGDQYKLEYLKESDGSSVTNNSIHTTPVVAIPTIAGGTETKSGIYTIRTFIDNGTLNVSGGTLSGVEVLIVGMGEHGGWGGDGGNGGKVVSLTNQSLSKDVVIKVGTGFYQTYSSFGATIADAYTGAAGGVSGNYGATGAGGTPSSIDGTAKYYGGGGGGGGIAGGGAGGAGGGGNGSAGCATVIYSCNAIDGINGTPQSGGGGGGGGLNGAESGYGGTEGSGVVIVRYLST